MSFQRQSCIFIAAILLSACGQGNDAPSTTDPMPSATVAPDIRGEEVSYESGGVQLKGYLAYDAARSGARPGVLVVHEWWGHNEYVRERARMLAGLGYTAFALDMYGDGKQAAHPSDAQKFMMEALADLQAAEARFLAASSVLQDHSSTDPEKIAAIGYCFGGAVVLHMARKGTDLDVVASFHGSLGTESPAEPGAFKGRMLVAHGGADPFVPQAEVDAFNREMEAAGVDLEFVTYPGVMHSFTNPGATEVGVEFDLPLRYDEAADQDSWARLQALLRETFGD